MNELDKFEIFEKWLIEKYTDFSDVKEYGLKTKTKGKHYCTYSGRDTHLRLNTFCFPKWTNLLKKYTDKELINHFLEVVRVKLPELKGTKLIFPSNETNIGTII